MTRSESVEAAGTILAAAVVMLVIGLLIHLDPVFLGILIAVSSAGILPMVIRWSKRNRPSTGN